MNVLFIVTLYHSYALNKCNSCKYFIPDEFSSKIGKCSAFKKHMNQLESAAWARLNENLCGPNATKYKYADLDQDAIPFLFK